MYQAPAPRRNTFSRFWSSLPAFGPLTAERERWFLWTAPLFAVGISAYFKLLDEPHWTVAGLGLVLAITLRALMRSSVPLCVVANVMIIVAAGFAAAKLRTEIVRAPVLTKPIRDAVVTGYVTRFERRADKSRRLTLAVIGIAGLDAPWTPVRIRVRLPASERGIAPGTAVRVRARLSAPPAPAMPHGYDFARAAFYQRLGAVGFALAEPSVLEAAAPAPLTVRIAAALQQVRSHIGRRIAAALPGEVGAMANALMTGERGGISEATNDLYRDAGIFHILSISGLHMAIMGGSVFFAVRFLFAAIPHIALHSPIKKWAALAAALTTFGYLLISGGAHPTVRSFIMISVMFLAILLDRPALALRNVAIAALLILALTPESLFNAGFQLSFAAVVALIGAYEAHTARARRQRRRDATEPASSLLGRSLRGIWIAMAGTVATTVIAGVATAPFAAFHFHTSQQYSVLTNMLAIPVSNLIVMPAALASFIAMPVGLETWPLQIMGIGIDLMTWSARQVVALPGAVLPVPAYPEMALQLMIAGGLWFLIWRRTRRWLGVVVGLIGLYVATSGRHADALVGPTGALVAVRDAAGHLAAMKSRRGRYAFARWLEADGDARAVEQAWSRAPYRCDLEGCLARLGRRRVAMPRSPAALIDDCRRADLLVLTFPRPAGCRTSALVLDYPTLQRGGTHALYMEPDGKLRIENVEQFRGRRPWTLAARAADRRAAWHARRRAARDAAVRASGGQAPISWHAQRPEIEDDGHPLYWWR